MDCKKGEYLLYYIMEENGGMRVEGRLPPK